MIKLEALLKMKQEDRYKYMLIVLEGQLSSEKDSLANLCNATAIIKTAMEGVNWAGFYILKKNYLVLGPFQGLLACNRIEIGKGVCGAAVYEKKLICIEDVHLFPGHIACDSASNSEIVIPIINCDKIYGVLDVDSPEKGRFGQLEEKYLIKFMEKLNNYINWEKIK